MAIDSTLKVSWIVRIRRTSLISKGLVPVASKKDDVKGAILLTEV